MKRITPVANRIWKDVRAWWGFGLLLAGYDILAHLLFKAFCPLVIVTGIPCPGCGMTRAIFFFLTGQFERGWRMNPLGILWILLAIYFFVMRYVLGKKPKGILQMGGVIVVLMIGLYGFRMAREFPGNPPISYTPGNLAEQILPGYRQWVMR